MVALALDFQFSVRPSPGGPGYAEIEGTRREGPDSVGMGWLVNLVVTPATGTFCRLPSWLSRATLPITSANEPSRSARIGFRLRWVAAFAIEGRRGLVG